MNNFLTAAFGVLFITGFAAIQPLMGQELKKTGNKPSGLSIGGTPILAYDADLGLKYGAVVNLFDYGDEGLYPRYSQYANFRIFNTTGGTFNLSAYYEPKPIRNGLRMISELSLVKDRLMDFYGFNGVETRLRPEFVDPDHAAFLNRNFYSHQRKTFQIRHDFQVPTGPAHSRFYLGLAYKHYQNLPAEYHPADTSERVKQGYPTLFENYVDWGIIAPEEQSGGNLPMLSAGYIYDTRDNMINCKTGFWFETFFLYSPPIFKNSSFSKFVASFRYYHYWPFIDAVWSARVSAQHKITGRIPYYALSNYYDTRQINDGLGGAFNLRGIGRARILADGYVLINTEFRKSLLSFWLAGIAWQVDLSLFLDAAYVSQPYIYPRDRMPESYRRELLTDRPQGINLTLGPGLYLIYNTNNIISVNWGFSPDSELGSHGLYIGSGFLF